MNTWTDPSVVLIFRLRNLETRIDELEMKSDSKEEAQLLSMLSYLVNHATVPEWLCEDMEEKVAEFEKMKGRD